MRNPTVSQLLTKQIPNLMKPKYGQIAVCNSRVLSSAKFIVSIYTRPSVTPANHYNLAHSVCISSILSKTAEQKTLSKTWKQVEIMPKIRVSLEQQFAKRCCERGAGCGLLAVKYIAHWRTSHFFITGSIEGYSQVNVTLATTPLYILLQTVGK